MLILKIYKDENSIPTTFNVDKFPVTIGRSKLNDISLEDARVSNNHCKLVMEDEKVQLIDLGSTNQIQVDGNRVGKVEITDGQIIYLGNIKIMFHVENDTHEKTQFIQIKANEESSIIKILCGKEAMIDNLYFFPMFIILFLESIIFTINIEFLKIIKGFIPVCFMLMGVYLVLVFLSKIINGYFFWRRIYRQGCLILTITFTAMLLISCIEILLPFSENFKMIIYGLITFLVIQRFSSLVFINVSAKLLNTVLVSVAIGGCLGIYIVKQDVDDKLSVKSSSTNLPFPIIHYSKSSYKIDDLFLKMDKDIKKVNKLRDEKRKEKDKYFKEDKA